VAALSRGHAGNSANQAFDRDSDENQQLMNPSVVVGAPPARSDEPRGGAAAAPAARLVVDQLARGIADHLRVGKQEAVLQLDPPDLGKVQIDLRIEEGQLQVRIATESHESQGLIEHHLSELRQALRAGQIDVGDLRVTQGESGAGSSLTQDFNQSPEGRQDTPRAFTRSGLRDEVATQPPAQLWQSPDGRVSMWA